MNTDTLLDIIRQGENDKTEFKASFNKKAIESIVAFANYRKNNAAN